jgi:large subunit ribosomal protein L1
MAKKRGKKYLNALKLIEKGKAYDPKAAVALVKQTSTTKFDATVESHFRLGVDPKYADQQVRGLAILPNGTGRKVRVLVFTQGDGVRIAEEAGADFVGSDELIKKVDEGWVDFEVAIATPDVMPKVSKLGKVLGRRGMMPNPKSGTIAPPADLPRLIREARKGRVEFKVDKTSNLHAPIGKVSFSEEQLSENLATLVEAVVKAKPAGAKGQYIKSLTIASTMGPGIEIDINAAQAMTAI